MKHLTRGLAGMIITALTFSATPVQAHTHDSIRYASIKACKKKDKSTKPCSPWRLFTHDGKVVELKDAQVIATDAKGKPSMGSLAPLSVSGDGQYVAYFRARDKRLVVRGMDGSVKLMPKSALPKKVGTDLVAIHLSLDGGTLVVDYLDDASRATVVYDMADPSHPGWIPDAVTFEGISGDGQEILATRGDDDNSTQVVTYDIHGTELTHATPPQVVVNNSPRALSADGRSIAVVSGSKKAKLQVYDLGSNTISQVLPLKLPYRDSPEMIDWTGAHQVTLHFTHNNRIATILQVDTGTGAIRVRDTYKIAADTFYFAFCGG